MSVMHHLDSVTDLVEDCPTVASLPSVYHRITEVMEDMEAGRLARGVLTLAGESA